MIEMQWAKYRVTKANCMPNMQYYNGDVIKLKSNLYININIIQKQGMYTFRQYNNQKQQQAAEDNDKIQNNQQTQTSQSQLKFEQYRKVYFTSYLLATEKKKIFHAVEILLEDLSRIQDAQNQLLQTQTNQSQKQRQKKNQESIIKRSRRKADDIQRQWECRQQYCGKKYGAQASLLQHVKLKHPSVYSQYC